MSTAMQLSENSHQGFEGLKAALCLASIEVKSNTASRILLRLRQNCIRSRSSGKERDAETGLDYFGARYSSAAQGRFMSPDPGPWVFLNPQSYNAYTYALNNPLIYTDDDGETPRDRVNAAYNLVGTNYATGGGHPGNKHENDGLDCSGLAYKAFKADPDNTLNMNGRAADQALRLRFGGSFSLDIGDAQAGDSIFWSDGSHIVHTGIVVDVRDGLVYFVHAPRPGKKANRFYVELNNPNLEGEKFAGVGRPIESAAGPIVSTKPAESSYLEQFATWASSTWNSWFGGGSVTPKKKPSEPKPKPRKKRTPPKLKDGLSDGDDFE
jgi:RHS repeat-associated protein